ncbi:MAG TPA: PfkB family carbohydrate kinase, partial [Saprospiraceae bacterium]|nr:PfkB family carbohydrate kinase [Saprospiraceae bacterium]
LALDTVGAGDVFSTAFLVNYAQQKDLDQACIFANCAASYIVEGSGLDNLPTLEMIEARVGKYLLL